MREAAVWGIVFVWVGIVTAGFVIWERYENTPGAVGPPPAVAPDPGPPRWRLTVFLHPRCPCSRATVAEIAEVVRQAPDLSARVVFVSPAVTPAGWERGEACDATAAIPGVGLDTDPDGSEARRLGAKTSGQAVLTDPAGRVVFRGGLTRGRGRAGESAGRRAVLDWITRGDGAATAPVFGCPLFTPDE